AHAEVDLGLGLRLAGAPLDQRNTRRGVDLACADRGRADQGHADDVRDLVPPLEVENVLRPADVELDGSSRIPFVPAAHLAPTPLLVPRREMPTGAPRESCWARTPAARPA